MTRIEQESGPFLLFGTTGSGKTEVYMRAAEQALAHDPAAQVLVLVLLALGCGLALNIPRRP